MKSDEFGLEWEHAAQFYSKRIPTHDDKITDPIEHSPLDRAEPARSDGLFPGDDDCPIANDVLPGGAYVCQRPGFDVDVAKSCFSADELNAVPQLRLIVHINAALGRNVDHSMVSRHDEAGPWAELVVDLLSEAIELHELMPPGSRRTSVPMTCVIEVSVVDVDEAGGGRGELLGD